MGRLDGIGEAIGALLGVFGLNPSPPVMAAFGLLLVAAMVPFFLKVERQRKLRKLVLVAARADASDRQAAIEAALAAADEPLHWVILAEEAHRRQAPKLAERALEGLRATGKLRLDLRRLEQRILKVVPTTAEAEAAAVERLREAGLDGEAERRLAAARARFPRSEVLAELSDGGG